MKPEIKEKLVAALRSGEYTQTKGFLRQRDCFCVLGVVCDLYSKEKGQEWDGIWFMGNLNTLPESVVEWAGLKSTGGAEIEIDGYRDDLWRHNDNGVPFSVLADAIEEQL